MTTPMFDPSNILVWKTRISIYLHTLGYKVHLAITKEYALRYGHYSPVIEGYSDANWIVDFEKSKSTSGYVFTLGRAAVSENHLEGG